MSVGQLLQASMDLLPPPVNVFTLSCILCGRHADVVAQLLEAGADPLLVDRHEHTCLHYAALFGWANCISALLEGAVRLGGTAPPMWLKDVRMDTAGHIRCGAAGAPKFRHSCSSEDFGGIASFHFTALSDRAEPQAG